MEFARRRKTGLIALAIGVAILGGGIACAPNGGVTPFSVACFAILGGLFVALGVRGLRSAHEITFDHEEVLVRWRWGVLCRWSRGEVTAHVSTPIPTGQVMLEFLVLSVALLLVAFRGDLAAVADFVTFRAFVPALIWGCVYERWRGVHRAVLAGREGEVKLDLRDFADREELQQILETLDEGALDGPHFELLPEVLDLRSSSVGEVELLPAGSSGE